MCAKTKNPPQRAIIDRNNFQNIIDALKNKGYRTYGPLIDQDGIIYDRLDRVEDMPVARIDRQDNGRYRLEKSERPALFDYVVPMHSWKRFFLKPVSEIYSAIKKGNGREIQPAEIPTEKKALIGIRSCELSAAAIQDRILIHGPYPDAGYAARRKDTFMVAVNCVRPGGTCFCDSMGTGPEAKAGFDLSLTEVINGEGHYFVAECGSPEGAELLDDIPHRDPEEGEIKEAEGLLKEAASLMGRKLDCDGVRDAVGEQFDNPYWDEIAQRCASCTNCTLVCPTCFCVNILDTTDLSGQTATRKRLWDSCYTLGFSYIHGGSIRNSTMARYRQWLMHKLVYWHDQFGSSGCVGCGRCITWCPVGIDITEEAARLASASEGKKIKARN